MRCAGSMSAWPVNVCVLRCCLPHFETIVSFTVFHEQKLYTTGNHPGILRMRKRGRVSATGVLSYSSFMEARVNNQVKKSPLFPLQLAFGFAIIALLVGACSLPGAQSTTTTTTTTPATGRTPTATPQKSTHPVADQPTGTGKLPSGTPLPQDEVKPLTFILNYNDTAMEQDVAQMYTPGSATFHQYLTPD